MPCIYKATNKNNTKSYIGFAENLDNRKVKHQSNARSGVQTKFYNAIRKHGWDAFDWEVLFDNEDAKLCHNVMEQQFIEKFDTLHSGYNMCEGGLGVPGVTRNSIWINNGVKHKRITEDLLKDFINVGWQQGRIGLVRTIKASEETKRKIGAKNKALGVLAKMNLEKIPCPHCKKEFNLGKLSQHLPKCFLK